MQTTTDERALLTRKLVGQALALVSAMKLYETVLDSRTEQRLEALDRTLNEFFTVEVENREKMIERLSKND